MKHALGMVIGCGLAFLAVFLLPALGVSGNVALVISLGLMVGCHLFMGHGTHEKEKDE
jgi:hypothetical protein